jgi:hypothetical protein
MGDYVINEYELERADNDELTDTDIERIRSRPLSEELKCQTCGGIVTHPMCDSCYENNIENTLQEALKAERERVLKQLYDRYVNAYLNPDNYNEINAKEVYKYIESLRSEQP